MEPDRLHMVRGWRDRLPALWHIVPIAFTAALNLTPFIFFPGPPDLRKLLYEQLSRSKLFALSGYPMPPRQIPGEKVWSTFQVYSMIVAQAFLPIGIPLVLWFSLDLGALVTADLDSKVLVAQLLTAAVIGAIAIGVFLSVQLHRISPVRMSSAFLQNDPRTSYQEHFVHRHVGTERFCSGQLKWIHLRLTNVGTAHLSDFQLRGEFPRDWSVPGTYRAQMSSEESAVAARASERLFVDDCNPDVPLASYARAFDWSTARNQFTFPTRLIQVGLGPGATTVFSILVMAPSAQAFREDYVKVSVSSSSTASPVSSSLKLVVDAEDENLVASTPT